MTAEVKPKVTTNLVNLEDRAARVLTARARAHLLAAAGGREAIAANARAFRRWRIVPRMFIERDQRTLATTVLGTGMPAAAILAPVRRQFQFHPEAELASARAAAALGLVYVHPSRSSRSLEAVAQASGSGPRWYAVDWRDETALRAGALRRARLAGFTHLLVTPPPGAERWGRLAQIRSAWDGPVLLSDVRTVADAKRAVEQRADGIVISNDPGQDRPAIATIDLLPRIADAIGSRRPILFGGDIQSAPDAYKALALGAAAVLVGRPYAYGLALDGQAGVTHVLRTLLAELDLTLANAGYASHRQLGRDDLVRLTARGRARPRFTG
jgi:L-lactate dehydrogenase (cytochrome)